MSDRERALAADDKAKEKTAEAKTESDLKEALDYVRESVKAGDTVLKALENAVEVFAPEKPAPFQPKPGERARLVASRGYEPGAHPLGRVYELFNVTSGEFILVQCPDERRPFYVHRDATWEPVSPAPYQPKPGERARLKASPDVGDHMHVGHVLRIVGIEPAGKHPAVHWDAIDEDWEHDSSEDFSCGIHRDATWEPVEPAPAQPPEPVEPSDDNLAAMDAAYSTAPAGRKLSRRLLWNDGYRVGYMVGYRAGLAAEAAARSKALDYWKHQTKHNRAELERVRAELERERTVAIDLGIMSVERAKELERLRSQARARRVPTRGQLAEAIQQAITQRDQNDGLWFDKYLRAADAAMTALGFQDSQGASPERENRGERNKHGGRDGRAAGNDRPGEHGHDDSAPGAQGDDRRAQERPEEPRAKCGHHEAGRGPDVGRRSDDDGPAGRVNPGGEGSAVEPKQRYAAQPSPLVTSDNEPPVPLPRYRTGRSVGRTVYELSGDDWVLVGVMDTVELAAAAVEGLNRIAASGTNVDDHYCIQQRAAEATPWKPTVGERAVLAASPDNGDLDFLDKELEILDVRNPSDPHYLPREHYACRAESVYPDRPLRIDIHRDATWRPASAAQAKAEPFYSEAVADTTTTLIEPDSAWLKRMVEELTTARPVEVTAGNDDGVWKVASPGQLTLFFGYSARERDTDGVWSNIAAANWPLRRNAKPAEPSPQHDGSKRWDLCPACWKEPATAPAAPSPPAASGPQPGPQEE